MPLSIGCQLGVYHVLSLEGSGGMGQVYRGRDSRLNREVALKVLPEHLASNTAAVARMKREAHVLAALNHPNIASIYDFEESGGVRALVLEFVEGPTLADRIAQGAIPLNDTLRMASQMAGALEAAHEHGIVHRDLKPSNIKVRPDGTVKVLDFGLAKAVDPAALGSDVGAPTITAAPWPSILGTAAYMSPEQARGLSVDRRTDIWAFGCVLFEMLTGRRAFAGETLSDVLVMIIEHEPDWTSLPARTPAPIRKLLSRCLEKDQKRRLDSAVVARIEIDDELALSAHAKPASANHDRRPWPRERLKWLAASMLPVLVTLVVARACLSGAVPVEGPRMRLAMLPPEGARFSYAALSPDGRWLAFSGATGAGVRAVGAGHRWHVDPGAARHRRRFTTILVTRQSWPGVLCRRQAAAD